MFIPIPGTNWGLTRREDLRPTQKHIAFSLDTWVAEQRAKYGLGSVTPQKAAERKSPVSKRHANVSRKAVTEGPTKRCAYCGKKITKRATYCKGSRCRTAAWRARLKNQ